MIYSLYSEASDKNLASSNFYESKSVRILKSCMDVRRLAC